MQNEPGVLSRVSGILAARGFNIDSLVVCSTEVADLSRMTIVLQGQDGVVEQARRQLEDLVPVWAVLDYTTAPLVQRELLLAKISILGPEYFEELLAHHREMTDADAWHQSTATEDMTPEAVAAAYDHEAAENRRLLLAKNHDYGEAWRQMRVASITDLILMKLHRVKQLEDIGGDAWVSESVEGSYRDMLNYAVFALILRGEASPGQ